MRTITESVAVALALVLCTAIVLPAGAQDESAPASEPELRTLLSRPLTVESAVRIAILRQPQLRAAELDVAAAEGRRVQAGLLPNPEVTLDLREPAEQRDPLQSDVEVELDLGHLLLAPARVGIASAEVEAARSESELAAVSLAHQVRVAFRELQAAERRWEAAARMLDTYVAARDAADALYAAGNITALAAAVHASACEEARAEVDELELAMHDARERLQRALGLYGSETTWRVDPTPPAPPQEVPDPSDVERRAIEASLDLARMRAAMDALARKTRLTRVEGWLPDLFVDVHGERDGERWEVGGGIRFSVPLFDRRQGDAAALDAELRALAKRHQAAAVSVRSQARMLRNRVVSAAARARHWRERVLPARRRIVEELLLQHNAMQQSAFALLEARRGEIAAELSASEATIEYWVADSALAALLAGASPEIPLPSQRTRLAGSSDSSGGGGH